uniref:Uncharacterized protein n=1 Tax=Brassica oleracea TaxID=3712 RepID=A0A3P6GB07_BRAOL|nr:unnamed protein product [Brassica oleracea]
MKSVKDLRVQDVVIASDYHEIVKAIARPELWPQYKALVDPISALKDGQFNSYLSFEGPSWLHDQIQRETIIDNI